MMNPSLEEVFLPDWGQALRRPKKSLFPQLSPQSRRQHFFRKIYLPDLQQSLPAGAAGEHCSSSRSPISPSSSPLPTPTTPPTCLNPILPLPPSRYHPKVLATEPPSFMVVKCRGPDSHAKGRFPGIYASNVSCWHHSAGTHRKGWDMFKFLQPFFEAKIWGTSSSSSEELQE